METFTKETQTRKILKLLKMKRVVTNYELSKIAFRYSARIMELRKDGYIIVSSHKGGSLWTFTFKGHEDDGKEYDDGN